MEAQIQEQTEPMSLRRELKQLSHQMGELRRSGQPISPELLARHETLTRQLQDGKSSKPAPRPAATPLTVELIDSRAQLGDLQPQWDDLLERADNTSPFITWEWWWPWLQNCATCHDPYVLVARDAQDRLVAGLPLVRTGGRRPQLRFMGSFNGPDPAYLRLPAVPERAAEARSLLLQRLASDCGDRFVDWRWDHCAVDSLLGDVMADAGREGLHFEVQVRRQYVHGPLPERYEDFIDGVPSGNRRNLMRHQLERLAREWAPPELIVHRRLTPEAQAIIAQMAAYNIKRRQAMGDRSRWNDKDFTRCLDRIMALFSERGWFRLFGLNVKGKLAAAFIGWAYRGTFFSYQIGETDEHPELGLGQCVVGHAIRSCIEEGLRHFEFLGEAHEWKRKYFPHLTPAATVHMGRDNAAYWSSVGLAALRRALARKLREVRHGD